jgi:hypothetical protein
MIDLCVLLAIKYCSYCWLVLIAAGDRAMVARWSLVLRHQSGACWGSKWVMVVASSKFF